MLLNIYSYRAALKPNLPFLETMLTQACNLSCLGCSNYSDLSRPGFVTWQQGQQWLEPWLERVSIPDFGIIGGEPLINPEVQDWLLGVRKLMPDSQIRFTTNGLLLHKHPYLLDLLHNIGNVVFKITVHVADTKLERTIAQIFDSRVWTPVVEHGISRWVTSNQLRLQINRPSHFVKTYQNTYRDMLPYDSVPSQAFKMCMQQTCPLLYQGKIFKCSTAGLLKSTLETFDHPNFERWEKYIDHGIGPDCSDRELEQFLSHFGKPTSICAQCPDSTVKKIIHPAFVQHKSGHFR